MSDSEPCRRGGGQEGKRLDALHEWLEERGPAPYHAVVAQICLCFECTPLQAIAEIERGPAGAVFEVMEAIDYIKTYQEVVGWSEEDSKANRPYPKGNTVDEVHGRLEKHGNDRTGGSAGSSHPEG